MNLVHLLDESINFLLTIPQVTTFNEVLELPRPESTRGVGELEWPVLDVNTAF